MVVVSFAVEGAAMVVLLFSFAVVETSCAVVLSSAAVSLSAVVAVVRPSDDSASVPDPQAASDVRHKINSHRLAREVVPAKELGWSRRPKIAGRVGVDVPFMRRPYHPRRTSWAAKSLVHQRIGMRSTGGSRTPVPRQISPESSCRLPVLATSSPTRFWDASVTRSGSTPSRPPGRSSG